jgi:septum formation protein
MLERAGLRFELASRVADDGELRPGGVRPEHWAASLAYLKAVSVARSLADDDPAWVLGADTVCCGPRGPVSKPGDADEARAMLHGFVGRTHGVVTGVALVRASGERELLADRACVRWGPIGAGAIETYLASGQWAGKAGGYNLAERVAAGWPVECVGDPDTVMGLPMRLLLPRLKAMGF